MEENTTALEEEQLETIHEDLLRIEELITDIDLFFDNLESSAAEDPVFSGDTVTELSVLQDINSHQQNLESTDVIIMISLGMIAGLILSKILSNYLSH